MNNEQRVRNSRWYKNLPRGWTYRGKPKSQIHWKQLLKIYGKQKSIQETRKRQTIEKYGTIPIKIAPANAKFVKDLFQWFDRQHIYSKRRMIQIYEKNGIIEMPKPDKKLERFIINKVKKEIKFYMSNELLLISQIEHFMSNQTRQDVVQLLGLVRDNEQYEGEFPDVAKDANSLSKRRMVLIDALEKMNMRMFRQQLQHLSMRDSNNPVYSTSIVMTSAQFNAKIQSQLSNIVKTEDRMKQECNNLNSSITLMPFDDDDLKEGLVSIKLPGRMKGECYVFNNLKQYWLTYVRGKRMAFEWDGPDSPQRRLSKPLFKLPISGVWIDIDAVSKLQEAGVVKLKEKYPEPTYIGAEDHFESSIYGAKVQVYTAE